jgi:hypothetical protein
MSRDPSHTLSISAVMVPAPALICWPQGRPFINVDPIDISEVLQPAEDFLAGYAEYQQYLGEPGMEEMTALGLVGELRISIWQIKETLEKAGLDGTVFTGSKTDKINGVTLLVGSVFRLIESTPLSILVAGLGGCAGMITSGTADSAVTPFVLPKGQVFNFDCGAVAEMKLAVKRLRRDFAPGPPAHASVPGATAATALELIAGGFALHGKTHDLTGRPRAILEALLGARYHRCTADGLRELLKIDDEAVNNPVQVVKDAVNDLKTAPIQAAKDDEVSWDGPITSTGKGKDLTYILTMP